MDVTLKFKFQQQKVFEYDLWRLKSLLSGSFVATCSFCFSEYLIKKIKC